jgi:hypothetical protein
MKQYITLAVLATASVINANAGEIGFGLSLANYKKTVNGNPPPVYYAPAAQQTVQAAAPAAPVAAPAGQQTPTMVAVPAGNGTYTLVSVVPAQPVQTYIIPANQVPLAKEEKSWSIGPRFSLFANK